MNNNINKNNEAQSSDLKQIKVTQIGSSIGRHYKQKQNLIGLGLGKMHKSAVLTDTASTRGMITKVIHLLRVEEI